MSLIALADVTPELIGRKLLAPPTNTVVTVTGYEWWTPAFAILKATLDSTDGDFEELAAEFAQPTRGIFVDAGENEWELIEDETPTS